mgnify:FL=1
MSLHRYPLFLSIVFIALSIWSGYDPASREVWIAEVIPVIGVFLILVFTYHKFQFSHLAYTLMSLWLYMHTIGAHYTFAAVPFDFVNDLIGSERNQFDRVAHYVIGFYAFPMAEWLTRKNLCGHIVASFFGLFFIMSIAATYEIIEWVYAVSEGGDAGIEFLGSQGDIWDAQKDMLADTLGAITSLALFLGLYRRPETNPSPK